MAVFLNLRYFCSLIILISLDNGLECVPAQKCDRIHPFYGGETVYNGERNIDSEAFYRCDDAYSMFPKEVNHSICTTNLTWDPDPPQCLKKANVTVPKNGNVCNGSKDLLLHSESSSVCCNQGFEFYSDRYLDQSSVRVTNNNGTLEPEVPKCIAKKAQVTGPKNGYVCNGSKDLLLHLESSSVCCKRGFELYSDRYMDRYSVIVTNNNGTLEPEVPHCKPARCDTADLDRTHVEYKNGSKITEKIPHLSELSLSCKDGYIFYGGHKSPQIGKCVKGKIKNLPKCIEAQQCKTIRPFNGGNVEYTDKRKIGSEAFYSCNDAYSMFPKDVDHSKCTTDLIWEPAPPQCFKKAHVIRPSNGHVCNGSKDILLHSESSSLCCKKGFELYSDRFLDKTRVKVINNNGTLEPEVSKCVKARCDTKYLNKIHVKYINGSNVTEKIPHGLRVSLSCEDGYHFYKRDEPFQLPVIRRCNKGKIRKHPECEEAKCLFSGYPMNRYTNHGIYLSDAQLVMEGQFVEPERKIRVDCLKDYELYVNETQTYLNLEKFTSECRFGQFDKTKKEFPICVEKRCKFGISKEFCFRINDDEDCQTDNFTVPSRSVVNMECQTGYTLQKSQNGNNVDVNETVAIICDKGTYSNPYTCIPKKCSVPKVMQAKLLSKAANTYEHEENITFLCNAGYHFDDGTTNKKTILETTCHLGEWIKPIPEECQEDLCSLQLHAGASVWVNSQLLNGKAGDIQTFENGSKLLIECLGDYKMKYLQSGKQVPTTRRYSTCVHGNWTHEYSCYAGEIHRTPLMDGRFVPPRPFLCSALRASNNDFGITMCVYLVKPEYALDNDASDVDNDNYAHQQSN